MSTDAQVAANRENSKCSAGPTTPEGKTRSSRNSTRHGLSRGFILMDSEDPEEFQRPLAELTREHQASTETENMLVQKMAEHYWSSQRAMILQGELLHCTMASRTRMTKNGLRSICAIKPLTIGLFQSA